MHSKINILIADRSQDLANLLKIKLSLDNNFFIVDVVQNDAKVIEILKHKTIDLIILDIILPNTDGLEILCYIKKMNFKTKAIVISTFSNEKIIFKALTYGAQYYFCKPFNFDSLIDKIKTIKFV